MDARTLAVVLLLVLLLTLLVNTEARHARRTRPEEEDPEDLDDSTEDAGEAGEADDGRVYKNPRNLPSALCPRDEQQAALLGQKCLRKCSTDEDCKSKKKKCLCDGACGLSCIKPERECEELTEPELGGVSLTGRLFGDRATYTCSPGYHVVGLQERTCQADGSWSGQPPACKHNVYCTSPPTLAHARHSAPPEQTTFALDTTLQYQCVSGYVTRGFPRAKCLAIDSTASWFGPDISCEPRSCGPPADMQHGWHAGECYTFGCRVTYHCADGFELVGRQERFCQADGSWTPRDLPTCVLVTAVQCPPPDNPGNGKAIFTSCSYNSVVSYECKYGYTLVGEPTRRCGADRRWTGQQPQCKAPCVVPSVRQGQVLLLIGDNETSPDLPLVVPHGERLRVDCEPMYEFPSNNTPVACNNGTWTNIPRCEPARCKRMPKAPRNGMVIAPKTEHGMKARFKCKDGFTLRGGNATECRYGNWTGDLPYCQEVYCPFPGYIENGRVMLVGNMGVYDYRPYVRKVTNNKQIMYECERGYVLNDGPPGATCIGGRWSPKELPRCTPGLHPRLRWSRSVREKRAVFLKQNYAQRLRLAEEERLKRTLRAYLLGKHWASIRYKRALLKGHTQPQQRQQLTKQKEDRKPRNRTKNRKPKHKGPKVKAGPCEPLSSEPYVKVEVLKAGRDTNHTHSLGSLVKVTCSQGYGPSLSNNTAKCVRGQWRPGKPDCVILPCKVPVIDHGFFRHLGKPGSQLNETADVDNGEVIEFACDQGYNVKGPSNLRCWHGQWTSTATATAIPECTPAPCELPPINNGLYLSGYRAGLTIAHGSSVTFQCDNDYSKSTAQPVECSLGMLKPRVPACRHHIAHGIKLGNVSSKPTEPDIQFKGGSDITKGGDISVIDFPAGFRRSCGPPARVQGSLVYRDGEPIAESDRSFPDGAEVTFNCIASIMGEKTTWRIICEDGSWVGRSLNCEGEDLLDSHVELRNSTCIFRNTEPNLVSFYNDQHITEEVVEFPPGSVLVSRCVDIGKYAMIGSSHRRCIGGEWDGQKPVCFGLNQENDYALEKPPTILFRHQLGPIAQSNDGRLIVYPGTILHMECLWIRRFGTPKWVISHNYRKYPEGWTTDPGRDPHLEYRLSIYHASRDDSGVFTCVTPTRHTHAVEIVVKAVHCPQIPSRRGLNLNTPNTKMNTKVLLSCANGNSLIGAPELTCLPSGNWSAPIPICESIECADLVNLTDPHLRVSILSREVGGRAVFSCAQGFGLRGPHEAICLPSGDWASPMPTCQEVQCDSPGMPENGYIQGIGPYKAGDVIQFNCNPEFMMEGQPIIACQENGRWSGTVPKCVQACSYPGTTISGRMSSVKFYYKIGETITFTCDEGLELRGAPMLRCLRNGKWSNAIPTCVSSSR